MCFRTRFEGVTSSYRSWWRTRRARHLDINTCQGRLHQEITTHDPSRAIDMCWWWGQIIRNIRYQYHYNHNHLCFVYMYHCIVQYGRGPAKSVFKPKERYFYKPRPVTPKNYKPKPKAGVRYKKRYVYPSKPKTIFKYVGCYKYRPRPVSAKNHRPKPKLSNRYVCQVTGIMKKVLVWSIACITYDSILSMYCINLFAGC